MIQFSGELQSGTVYYVPDYLSEKRKCPKNALPKFSYRSDGAVTEK
ncbi:hypothetical protein [Flavobacterium cupreum]|nr:hypothetical protein [Flavobacterium cupreum]